jgi:hypothetical protein
MELIRKQSESQIAYKQVKDKLDSLLKNVKTEKNKKKNSLGPIIYKENHDQSANNSSV